MPDGVDEGVRSAREGAAIWRASLTLRTAGPTALVIERRE